MMDSRPRVVDEPRIGRSVSLDDAANLLGVSRRTIYNRIRDGRLQTVRTLGGSQRVLLGSMPDLQKASLWRGTSGTQGTRPPSTDRNTPDA